MCHTYRVGAASFLRFILCEQTQHSHRLDRQKAHFNISRSRDDLAGDDDVMAAECVDVSCSVCYSQLSLSGVQQPSGHNIQR